MRRIKLYSLIILSFWSCVATDEYDIPKVDPVPVEIEGDITNISAVKGNYNFSSGEIYTFNDSNTWLEGFVISSDAGGNFYKKLILQDKTAQPTSGIQILIDDNALFQTYNFGRKLYVKLDGLSLWYNNGSLQLGKQNRGDVVAIPAPIIDEHIIRSEVTSDITPLPVEISDFGSDLKNLYVQIEDLQFNRNLVKEDQVYSFASNAVDRYDGQRQLENCDTGETVLLSTSTFSNFKSLLLPIGSGSVEGVLARDFFDDHYVILLNEPDKLDMNGERCDPEYLNCESSPSGNNEILFEENFGGITSNTTLSSRGWTNINLTGGEKKFTPTLLNGNRFLRISAYNTQESPLEVWLVSPAIDLAGSENATLMFDILSSFDNGLLLEVYITRDYNGKPREADWIPLDARIPLGPSGSYSNIFKESKVNISCIEGRVWIGFRYLGSAPDKTTTYDLDNIRIIGD
ncbi:DUF5689 domain-containing protein [Christiangramia salexigens]|uniref:DUF5689 domain-containing protein n=1 Tax=Christiangramia salexigens TaxID=1913577 RepID=A0A1L3J8N5_9FLAO|nr:DUF5689 domain-containing protein [Christiangramia salexigens]APG61463.1 hypothetical protein LPB144_11085 [Christiangramia salexigens]